MSERIKLSDGSSWPRPEIERDEESIAWKLTYAPHTLTRGEQLRAASFISSYGYLIVEATDVKARLVRREIRAALDGEVTNA